METSGASSDDSFSLELYAGLSDFEFNVDWGEGAEDMYSRPAPVPYMFEPTEEVESSLQDEYKELSDHNNDSNSQLKSTDW